MISSQFITSRAITKARFVCSAATIRSGYAEYQLARFRGRINRRLLGYEPFPNGHQIQHATNNPS